MEKIAVYPGSFDPATFGHIDIITRASKLFDKTYIAIGINTSKEHLIPINTRVEIFEKIFASEKNIEVIGYSELTIELCKKLGAKYIVRGIRNSSDWDYERNIAGMNRTMADEIETVFFPANHQFAAVNSSIVKEVWKMGGDISAFVPQEVIERLKR
ncbi:MAG: pantetheine-phosphate adenylyltransferase [Bacteroidetes bacterium]|nr:pantetheine-phosphate adenylyltransferase [Bacteroidota bacterium]